MAISYILASMPIWVLINNEGTVAGGAYLYTYDSQNKVLQKPVFSDPGGLEAYTNPIVFNLNGTQGPFYFEFDSSNPTDGYFLVAKDSNMNLLWTIDNFIPSGTGGGGDVTTNIPIQNYITNNQFIEHIAPTASPIASTNLVIAPSNHKGFTPAWANPVVGTFGVVGPDIRFIKNNTAATDQITFPLFPIGTNPLNGDVCPEDYIRYQCTSPAAEAYKNFQFPICQKVQVLADQSMTFTLWAAVTTTPVTLDIYVRQYFGSGTAASPDTRTLIGSIVLSTTWTKYVTNFIVPSIAGMSLGTPGLQTDDDATYLQIEMPLDLACDVLFTKPCVFLGTLTPSSDFPEFDSYDLIDSVAQTPRTGDTKTSYVLAPLPGWIQMGDGTIGNVGSGASLVGDYLFQLYKTLWDSVSNTYAPVAGGRGATGVADFIANKALSFPLMAGRSIAAAGSGSGLTVRPVGSNSGTESNSITLLAANLPPHTHAITAGGGSGQAGSGVVTLSGTTQTGPGPGTSTPITISSIQPTSWINVFIKI